MIGLETSWLWCSSLVRHRRCHEQQPLGIRSADPGIYPAPASRTKSTTVPPLSSTWWDIARGLFSIEDTSLADGSGGFRPPGFVRSGSARCPGWRALRSPSPPVKIKSSEPPEQIPPADSSFCSRSSLLLLIPAADLQSRHGRFRRGSHPRRRAGPRVPPPAVQRKRTACPACVPAPPALSIPR